MNEQKEKYKIIVMAILLAGACVLTYYFHAILDYGRVFTHFFYIPIILAALWWRRKGLVVAIFLAALIIFSHIFVRAEVVTANDYLRALMFIVIAFVVVALSEQIVKAQEKITHLNAILRAIRNVNQLIVREKDRDCLIQGACENLIETRGYYSAWIALVDESQGFLTAAEAGLGESFFQVVEMMKRGEFTRYGKNALKQSGIVVVDDVTAADCADCPLAGTYAGRAGMVIRLEYPGRIYGILSVSLPVEMAIDPDEQSLFGEVAGDIAFGLHSLEQEEGLMKYHDRLEKLVERRTQALRESERQYRVLFETANDAIFLSDETGRFVDINQVACESLGYSKEELLKMSNSEIDIDPRGHGAFLKLCNGPEEQTTFEVSQRRKDGTLLPVEITRSFFASGGKRLTLAIARDITERKQAEEALRQKSEEQKVLLSTIPTFVYFKDRNDRYVAANRAFADMTGTPIDEIAGETDYDFFPREEAEFYRKCDQEVMESGESKYNIEETVTGAEGKKMWVSTSKTPLFDSNGNVIGMVGITLDITERKRAEEEVSKSRKFLATIIDNIPDTITIRGTQHRFALVNQAYCNITGRTKEQVIGKTTYWEKDKEVFQTGKGLSIPERTYTDIEGKRHYVSVKKAPLTDESGEVTHVVTISRDITKRKEIEDALRAAYKELETLDKMKTDFLNVAYHEMRSPLAPIVGYTSLLEQGELTEKQKKYVRIIGESAFQLEALIESLLEVTRIEAGKVKLTLQTVSIPETVNDVLERVKLRAEAKKQTIYAVVPRGIEVEGDTQKITAIFDNLISNAIKYTGEEGRIDIVVEDMKEEEEIRVCVADTGVGIPKEHLRRVFERFYMIDNSLTRKGGLGLGLTIVKGYVDLHGGRVWATSEPGKGSKFWFTLPKR